MAEEGNVAGKRDVLSEGGVQAYRRSHDAEAIRTDDPERAETSFLQNLGLKARALRADLLESSGNNDSSLYAGGYTFADETRNRGRGGDDHGEIDAARNASYGRVAGQPQHFGSPRVNRKDLVARFRTAEILDHGAADTFLPRGGADNSDASWAEDEIERVPLGAQDIVRGLLDDLELVIHRMGILMGSGVVQAQK